MKVTGTGTTYYEESRTYPTSTPTVNSSGLRGPSTKVGLNDSSGRNHSYSTLPHSPSPRIDRPPLEPTPVHSCVCDRVYKVDVDGHPIPGRRPEERGPFHQ